MEMNEDGKQTNNKKKKKERIKTEQWLLQRLENVNNGNKIASFHLFVPF